MKETGKANVRIEDFDFTYEDVVFDLRKFSSLIDIMSDYGSLATFNPNHLEDIELKNNVFMLSFLACYLRDICDKLEKYA